MEERGDLFILWRTLPRQFLHISANKFLHNGEFIVKLNFLFVEHEIFQLDRGICKRKFGFFITFRKAKGM